jgi:hypothetical protein
MFADSWQDSGNRNPTTAWLAGLVTGAFSLNGPASSEPDRDGAFRAGDTRRIHSMNIGDNPVAARSPQQNGPVERSVRGPREQPWDVRLASDLLTDIATARTSHRAASA